MKKTKIITILLISIIILNSMQKFVKAIDLPMNEAYIENLGQCEMHLQYWKESDNIWSYIVTTMVGYRINGNLHYAYCMQQDRKGVGADQENYSVKISEMLKNENVWRAIINGFPYKTATELGVANDQDAFVATKQAIYCTLYNWNADTRYRGVDERGWQIVNAIKNIVQAAKTGTQTPSTSNVLKINKIGDLKKDLNGFYSQEFIVNSSVEMNNYTISNLENFPQGSFSSDMNNNAKTQFSKGEHFKILIPSKNILDDFNGKIKINGKVKTYPIFYGASYDSNLQDYALTYDSFDTIGDEISLKIDAHKSSIKIIKKDAENDKPISGVEFNLKYLNGTNIGNFTTNEDGIINITGLKQGKIIVTEIKTQNNYILDENSKELVLNYNESTQIEIANNRKKGQIKIIKISEDDNLINGIKAGSPIENVEFEIYDSNGNLVDILITDKNGIAISRFLTKGSYTIKETKSGNGYLVNEKLFCAEINTDKEIVEIKITNKSDTPYVPKLPVTGY